MKNRAIFSFNFLTSIRSSVPRPRGLFQRPNRQNPSDVQKQLSLFKFACSHLHQRHFLCHSTAANLNTDRAPPSPNLLANICTCAVFPTASPQPTSMPTGYRPPQICLQLFAPAAFSPPLHLNQPQYRRGTATLKFACRHLHVVIVSSPRILNTVQ